MKNLNELQKLELLGLVVGTGLALLALIPFFVFDQPGWLIGVGIGTAIELFNIFLLYKGSENVLRNFKSYQFLLIYFLRLTLFLIGFAIAVMLDVGFGSIQPITVFHNSVWGVLIAYSPLQIIVVVIMRKSKKGIISIAENLDKKEE